MPPRKSDQRKSDVSTARFALKDQDPQAQTSATASSSTPTTAASTSAAAAPKTSSTAATEDVPASEKKDGKEKEKEKDKDKDKDATAIEDLSLPKSIITRLAKGVLPANTQIQANAVLAMSKSTTVFVNYLASYANEHTQNAGKKTISPADVFKALDDIEFGFLKEPLEAEFAKFNAVQTEKRTSYRNKVKAAKEGPTTGNADTSIADTTMDSIVSTSTRGGNAADESTMAPPSKKARVDPSAPGDDEEHDDAETEDEEPTQDDDEDEEMQEEEEDEEEDDTQQRSGDETQDALEESTGKGEDRDEALDGDESD